MPEMAYNKNGGLSERSDHAKRHHYGSNWVYRVGFG